MKTLNKILRSISDLSTTNDDVSYAYVKWYKALYLPSTGDLVRLNRDVFASAINIVQLYSTFSTRKVEAKSIGICLGPIIVNDEEYSVFRIADADLLFSEKMIIHISLLSKFDSSIG